MRREHRVSLEYVRGYREAIRDILIISIAGVTDNCLKDLNLALADAIKKGQENIKLMEENKK